jgi:hypothetical protein
MAIGSSWRASTCKKKDISRGNHNEKTNSSYGNVLPIHSTALCKPVAKRIETNLS